MHTKRYVSLVAALPAFCFLGATANAAQVPLASQMDPAGTISESTLTGETFVISNGTGVVANGLAGDDDSNPAFGDPVNLFPREEAFEVGTLDFDASGITGSGVENAPIDALDLSGLWSPDAERTNSTPGTDASVESDISDWAIGLWLFNSPGDITFGPLDAADTVTFTNGLLTSVDFSVAASFSVDATVWQGTLSAVGDQLSFQINDTQQSFFGPSTLVVDLVGTIDAVGSFAIPEPSAAAMALALFNVGLLRRRR